MLYIYKTTNLVNSKIYIGKNEKDDDSGYLGSGTLLLRAIKKYGVENFEKDILEICESKEELNDREKFWIEKCDSQNHSIGYNITKGGTGGDTYTNNPNKDDISKKRSKALKGKKHTELSKKNMSESRKGIIFSEEHRENISKAKLGNTYKKGKKLSEESRKKISEVQKGRKTSEETREKMSKTRKGRTVSEETREKMSNTKKGKVFTEEHREKLRLAWEIRRQKKLQNI